MPETQLTFGFDGSEARERSGIEAWREERLRGFEAMAHQLGLPLHRHVRVELVGGALLEGLLLPDTEELFATSNRSEDVRLRIGSASFAWHEVIACVAA